MKERLGVLFGVVDAPQVASMLPGLELNCRMCSLRFFAVKSSSWRNGKGACPVQIMSPKVPILVIQSTVQKPATFDGSLVARDMKVRALVDESFGLDVHLLLIIRQLQDLMECNHGIQVRPIPNIPANLACRSCDDGIDPNLCPVPHQCEQLRVRRLRIALVDRRDRPSLPSSSQRVQDWPQLCEVA